MGDKCAKTGACKKEEGKSCACKSRRVEQTCVNPEIAKDIKIWEESNKPVVACAVIDEEHEAKPKDVKLEKKYNEAGLTEELKAKDTVGEQCYFCKAWVQKYRDLNMGDNNGDIHLCIPCCDVRIKPLKPPKRNCKRCYGRGHEGTDLKTKVRIPCQCLRRGKTNAKL